MKYQDAVKLSTDEYVKDKKTGMTLATLKVEIDVPNKLIELELFDASTGEYMGTRNHTEVVYAS